MIFHLEVGHVRENEGRFSHSNSYLSNTLCPSLTSSPHLGLYDQGKHPSSIGCEGNNLGQDGSLVQTGVVGLWTGREFL
jgi:hypothetical protein